MTMMIRMRAVMITIIVASSALPIIRDDDVEGYRNDDDDVDDKNDEGSYR